ncbi:MAG TPA: pyridoxal phosphate-dependent aminotransferase [Firmicutes bacterium]|nr:pyridoxal phosphate-dependent aminotransferase [Bacillota bacterium]
MHLSTRIASVAPSATLAVDALVRQARLGGVDVVGFGTGEPDFDTPEHIKEAARAALRDGRTKYTPSGGTAELRRAICADLARRGLSYAPEEVIAAAGAKQALYNAFQVLLNPGDEVLIPAPYWVSYVEMVRLAGGVPVIVPGDERDGFVPRLEALRERLSPRTRAVVVNSPANPTGALWPPEVLQAVGELAVERGLVIVSDEIYDRLVYDGARPVSVAALAPEFRERTLVINGVSKTYAMTGWRIGYAAGPAPVIRAMETLQSHSTSNPNAIAQAAAVAALTGPQDPVEAMRAEFDARRRLMVEGLNALPGVSCRRPSGAFYAFPNVSALLGRGAGEEQPADSTELAKFLLQKARVAVVPGIAFGAEGYVRLSYATSRERIAEGLRRIEAALAELAGE